MPSLTFTSTINPVPTLRLTAQELEKEAQRAAVDTARRLQTRARAVFVEQVKSDKGSAVRRIRQYGNKVWFGTDPVVMTPPYIDLVVRDRGHFGIFIEGELVRGAFALRKGRWSRLPFLRVDSRGNLQVLRRDIQEEQKDVWLTVSAEVEEIYQIEMDKRAERVIRRRPLVVGSASTSTRQIHSNIRRAANFLT